MSLWIAAVLAACMFAVFWKSRHQFSQLAILEPGEFPDASVLIVIPTRNESQNLSRCLDSLAGQAGRVRVVDDSSTDDTREIAASKNVEVMKAPPLPPGLAGKPSACYAGSKDVAERWLLFLDADTWYEPGFVEALIGHAEDLKLDVVSAFLDHRCRTPWEIALYPYGLGLAFAGVNLAAVHNIKKPPVIAFGECMLFRTSAYEFTGGHRSMLRSTVDDLDLAKVAKRHRLRYEVVRAEHFGHVRPGASLLDFWRTYQRTLFHFFAINPWPLAFQVTLSALLMLAWAPVLAWLWFDEQKTAAYAFAAVPSLATIFWYRNPLGAILAPFAIYLFGLAALYSTVTNLSGMTSSWKGRQV